MYDGWLLARPVTSAECVRACVARLRRHQVDICGGGRARARAAVATCALKVAGMPRLL
jgi:hypothetical protein